MSRLLYFPNSHEDVVSGKQTRAFHRAYPGETAFALPDDEGDDLIFLVLRNGDNGLYPLYEVEEKYGIRTHAKDMKPANHIILENIQWVDVRELDDSELADPLAGYIEFVKRWTAVYDKPTSTWLKKTASADTYAVYDFVAERPSERYAAWALDFRLAK